MSSSQRFITSDPARNDKEEDQEMKEGISIIQEYGSDDLKQVLDTSAVILNNRAMMSVMWLTYGRDFRWTSVVMERIHGQLTKGKRIPHAGRYILKVAANVRREREAPKSISPEVV